MPEFCTNCVDGNQFRPKPPLIQLIHNMRLIVTIQHNTSNKVQISKYELMNQLNGGTWK